MRVLLEKGRRYCNGLAEKFFPGENRETKVSLTKGPEPLVNERKKTFGTGIPGGVKPAI
jgi:hypothetical protein